MRKCGNCKNRCFGDWSGMIDTCIWYSMTTTEKEEIEEAANCGKYEEGTPDCLLDEAYCPSATTGDYSPSSPWNAPGMSARDFI